MPDNKPGANGTFGTVILGHRQEAAAYKELEGVERDNLKGVGLLAKQ